MNHMAIVVCAVRLPLLLYSRWFQWNRLVIESANATLIPIGVAITIPAPPTTIYSPARASNIGIRRACDSGAGVVVKTDIDCILDAKFIVEALELERGTMLAPWYHDAVHAGDEAGRVMQRPCGTVAMWAADWRALCGYDERMYGYGREDGDLLRRAKLAKMRVTRRQHQVYHVRHESRISPEWYPMRRSENLDVGTDPWKDERWGTW